MPTIDLSHSIHPQMPLYPGSEATKLSTINSIEKVGFSEQRLCLNTHSGTHLDAPAHMIRQGKTIDQFPVDYFTGPACVIDCSRIDSAIIDETFLFPFMDKITASTFVLFHTAWGGKWGSNDYFVSYPVLSQQACQWLCRFDLHGVGFDTMSIDHPTSVNFPNHHLMLTQEILIIENLHHLEQLPPTSFTLYSQPLPLKGADGAPARVMAVW